MSDTAFKGEDESAGAAPPALDLGAAAFLFVLGAVFAGLSLALPVPGKIFSAPGLLPFLTSASLCVMAVLLGLSAWRRRALPMPEPHRDPGEGMRRLVAIVAVAGYLAALDALRLEGFVPVLGLQVPVGGFEPATILFLLILLRLFWTVRPGPLVAVAVGWTLCLSLAFRGLFGIPLPG